MSPLFGRSPGPDLSALAIAAGERALASAPTRDGGVVAGTLRALYVPGRVAWEEIDEAGWDAEEERLTVRTTDGHALVLDLDDATRLLQLVRERVTASVVLQRHVPISGRLGVRVAVRRRGDGSLVLTDVLDAGLDPDRPSVREAVARARAELAGELGLEP